MPERWICSECGVTRGVEEHLPDCEYLRIKEQNVKNRLKSKSDIICNLDLVWGENDNVCRDLIKNNADAVREHMIKRHGWKKIPQLAQEYINKHKPHPKTKQIMTEESYLKFINEDPKEWFFDNQLIYQEFRKRHFKNPLLIK